MEEPNLADALRSADLRDQDQEEDQGEDANMENLRDPLVVDDARSADAHQRGAQDADAHQSVDADASTASSRTLPSVDDARSADASHTSSVLTRTLTCTLK